MMLRSKDLLGLEDLTREEIELILQTAESFKEISERDIKKVPTLRGKTIITFFYEASTRTRISFEIAGKRLSADTINISAKGSSITKGESLLDTARNLQAMNPDVIVVRHHASGAPQLIAREIKASVINAGDGCHEHPTQALLDLFTVREKKHDLSKLKVVIVGDIRHSRVARSNIFGFTRMGAEVILASPATTFPAMVEKLGAKKTTDLESVIPEADVIMVLRIQKERGTTSFIPSFREYSRLYGINLKRLKNAKKDLIIMHPGPINRGIEIDPEVIDSPYSLILDQVTNGVAIRMALLFLLIGGKREEDAS